MAQQALGVRFTAASAGTGSFVNSSTVTGYAGTSTLVDGATYRYRAESLDLSQWEWGTGVWTAATSTLARTTIALSSAGSSAVSFAAQPQVAIVIFPSDVLQFDIAMSLTSTQKDNASTNLGTVRAVRKQVFLSSGTYTPDPHLLYVIFEAVGGGGGGGGQTGPGANMAEAAPGGGAGSISRTYASAATVGASQAVTIGAAGAAGGSGSAGGNGGDTSVGTLCIGKGGSGGAAGGTGTPGAGGVAGTGDVTSPGQSGFHGMYIHVSAVLAWSGEGGSGLFGSGGSSVIGNGGAVAGNAGTGHGSGGSGAATQGTTGSAGGGAGTLGIVIATEFCSQ